MSSHTNSGDVTEPTGKLEENPWAGGGLEEKNDEVIVNKQDGLHEAGQANSETSQDVSEVAELQKNIPKDTPISADMPNLLNSSIGDAATYPVSNEEMSILPQDPMESSTATLKPLPAPATNENAEASVPHEYSYLDPTPKTPMPSLPPSRSASNGKSTPHYGQGLERSPTRSDIGFDERHSASDDDRESGSRSEIQTIMDQFDEEGGGPGEDEVMSPRLQYAGPLLSSPMLHPPRKSSLEPLNAQQTRVIQDMENLNVSGENQSTTEAGNQSDVGPAVPPKPSSIYSTSASQIYDDRSAAGESTMPTLHRPPPPEPEREPELPFDFHRFLEQLRHKTADPVAKYTRSFLTEFAKKQWMVHEQVKIIGDFLIFITGRMAQCEVWRDASDTEFDNAREGMEKLIMNRLYSQTFSPAIEPPQPLPVSRGRGKHAERAFGPGRKGQHQEDVERDEILAQKISIYGWIKEEHLDIPPVGDSGKRFLLLAQQELLKIRNYRAPRDKIIQVLNCCKVIFGLLKHSKSDSSADSFMPLLIYVVLQANPEHLVSNVQYILRFRNQDKLSGEAGYYLSSLSGAIQFIENLDRTTLTITDKEFEDNVEAAVSAIAEKHQAEEHHSLPPVKLSEKSAPSRPEVITRHSMEAESSMPRKSTSSYESASDGPDEKALSGLLRTIQRPLNTIGRIFSDSEPGSSNFPGRKGRRTPPTAGNTPRGVSPNLREKQTPQVAAESSSVPQRPVTAGGNAEEAAARQASAEAFEAQKMQRAEHKNVVETLASMFPNLDNEVISDVVRQKEGRYGLPNDSFLKHSEPFLTNPNTPQVYVKRSLNLLTTNPGSVSPSMLAWLSALDSEARERKRLEWRELRAPPSTWAKYKYYN